MSNLVKLFFILAPLVGQGILTAQQQLGVNHPTVAGTIAGWLVALALSGRAVVSQDTKNLNAAGSDVTNSGS